jgi:hypothetical protein
MYIAAETKIPKLPSIAKQSPEYKECIHLPVYEVVEQSLHFHRV